MQLLNSPSSLVNEPDTTKESVAANWHCEVATYIGCFEVEFSIPFTCAVFQLLISYQIYMLYLETPNPHDVMVQMVRNRTLAVNVSYLII